MSAQNGLCMNCNARPATPGYQYCSKECAHAAQKPLPPQPSQPTGGGFIPKFVQTHLGIGGSNPSTAPVCLIPGCNKPVWQDANGNPSQYCSVAHKRLGGTCQIPGCGKPVYKGAKGVPSQYCSINHMRQGQAAQQTQQPGASITGPTNGPPAAPSQGATPNIPGGYPSHAAAAPPQTWPPQAQPGNPPGICQLHGCQKHVWVDPTGNPSKYCSRGHKAQAASQPQQQSHWKMAPPPPSSVPQSHYGAMPPSSNMQPGPPPPQASVCWSCRSQPALPNDLFCSTACISKGQRIACEVLEMHPLKTPPVAEKSHTDDGPPGYQPDYSNIPSSSSGVYPGGFDARMMHKGGPDLHRPTHYRRNSADSVDYEGMPD